MKERITIIDAGNKEATFGVIDVSDEVQKGLYGGTQLATLRSLVKRPLLRSYSWEETRATRTPWPPGITMQRITVAASEDEKAWLVNRAIYAVREELKSIGMEEEATTVIRGATAEDERQQAFVEVERVLK